MYEMPTDLQYKDELRKERIRIEDELEMLRSKEYEKLEKKLERDLARVNEGIESETQGNRKTKVYSLILR